METKVTRRNFVVDTLNDLGFNPVVLLRYDEEHRFYHNWEHIDNLLDIANQQNVLDQGLLLSIIFHDIIYNPKSNNNEELSAELFVELYKNSNLAVNNALRDVIMHAILDTKTHTPSNETSKILCELDLRILQSDLGLLIDYENKIFKEFQFVDWLIYKEERVKVLKQLQKNFELESLIKYVEVCKPNIAVYPGSFNPFHKGHYNILLQAEQIFDKVIIARGKNTEKSLNDVFALPEKLQFRQLEIYDGLLTDFINKLGYDVTLIRGLRNATDLQYELTQYRFLQDLKPNIKVVSFFCEKQFEHISSSGIRQLKIFGKEKEYLI